MIREVKPATKNLRELIGDMFFLISLAALLLGQIAFAVMWIYAWQHGIYPNGPFDDGGPGGPWTGVWPLERQWIVSQMCFIVALISSLICFTIKFRKRSTKALAVACLASASWLFFFFVLSMLMER